MPSANDISDRLQLVPATTGVYALRDLDGMVIYVGQATSVKERGISGRIRRHLTSARSDVVANSQLDPWEVSAVSAWSAIEPGEITEFERRVYAEFMNTIVAGRTLTAPTNRSPLPPSIDVTVLAEAEIARRKIPSNRLPRQVRHIDHLLAVLLDRKDSTDQRRSLQAHIRRLQARYDEFVRNRDVAADPDDDDTE